MKLSQVQAHSYNSVKLNDRTLWFDGDSTVNIDFIIDCVSKGKPIDSLCIDKIDDEIIKYNKIVPPTEKILIKENLRKLDLSWNIPDEYKKIDVVQYVINKLIDQHGNSDDFSLRSERCAMELSIYKNLKLIDTLRAIIYVINILTENNIVWGVGRGSSVSSYVLYIIGVHDVDSFLYDLDIYDFLKPQNIIGEVDGKKG